jgi:menaquinone-specific isochorismate synthase
VFARALVLHASDEFAIAPIVQDLARRFEHAMLFSIDQFIGASPELLVSRIGRTVRAHPLAGTAARRDDPTEDAAQIAALLASSKDRVEHQITIDWLLEELLAFSSYVDAEPEPAVVSLSNVHHLGTLVEGVLSEPAASVLDLVVAVHPTPAVGGNPQGQALELIAELEGFDRERYAGPAGWVDGDGNGQFAVSVRTAQVDGNTATICAGVGVVAQSDPQAELEETQAKFRAMLGSFLTRPS